VIGHTNNLAHDYIAHKVSGEGEWWWENLMFPTGVVNLVWTTVTAAVRCGSMVYQMDSGIGSDHEADLGSVTSGLVTTGGFGDQVVVTGGIAVDDRGVTVRSHGV